MSHTASRNARSRRSHVPEMTSMERVLAAVSGERADRIPYCVWHHFRPRGNPTSLARDTLDFFSQYGCDIFKIMPDIPYPFPDGGIRGADDWSLISELDVSSGNLARMLTTVGIVRDALGGDAPVLLTVFSPFAYTMRFAGHERLREHLRTAPIQLHAALDVIADNLAEYCSAALLEGADGIFLAVQGAGDGFTTAAEYAEFARPYELRVLRACQAGWLTTLHVHASSDLDLDPFLAYPTPVLSWSDRLTGISLADVRKRDPARCLMGGISERGPILSGTPAELLTEMRDAVRQTSGSRLILANGCSVPDDIADARLRLARAQADLLN